MVFKKVYLIGNGRVADDCLRIMVKKGVPVEFVEICTEKFSFTERLCERLNIRFKHYDKAEIKDFLLGNHEKTLIISAHNSYIFPADVCAKENLTIINLHIAFLPEYRGMNPSTWAIYNQEKYAGVTWHTVSSKIDNGGIIVQKRIEIGEDESAMKLMLRCFQEGIKLFEENLDRFLDETFITFIPAEPNTRLYLARDLPNNGFVDDLWDFNKTYAFLRSMDYSGANLMQLPRIKIRNKIYEIIKYKKVIDGRYCPAIAIEQIDDHVNLKWGGYCLCCTLREVVEK